MLQHCYVRLHHQCSNAYTNPPTRVRPYACNAKTTPSPTAPDAPWRQHPRTKVRSLQVNASIAMASTHLPSHATEHGKLGLATAHNVQRLYIPYYPNIVYSTRLRSQHGGIVNPNLSPGILLVCLEIFLFSFFFGISKRR